MLCPVGDRGVRLPTARAGAGALAGERARRRGRRWRSLLALLTATVARPASWFTEPYPPAAAGRCRQRGGPRPGRPGLRRRALTPTGCSGSSPELAGRLAFDARFEVLSRLRIARDLQLQQRLRKLVAAGDRGLPHRRPRPGRQLAADRGPAARAGSAAALLGSRRRRGRARGLTGSPRSPGRTKSPQRQSPRRCTITPQATRRPRRRHVRATPTIVQPRFVHLLEPEVVRDVRRPRSRTSAPDSAPKIARTGDARRIGAEPARQQQRDEHEQHRPSIPWWWPWWTAGWRPTACARLSSGASPVR